MIDNRIIFVKDTQLDSAKNHDGIDPFAMYTPHISAGFSYYGVETNAS